MDYRSQRTKNWKERQIGVYGFLEIKKHFHILMVTLEGLKKEHRSKVETTV